MSALGRITASITARASTARRRAPTRRLEHVASSARVIRQNFTAADDDVQTSTSTYKPIEEIDVDGMKKETLRRIDRAMKKVGKTTTKLRQGRERVDALLAREDATDDELLAAPDVEAIEAELKALKTELADLNTLSEILMSCKSTNSPAFAEEAYPLAAALDVKDEPPARPPRVVKQKGPKNVTKPRMPYWTFVSVDGIDIRVGRTSSDNDSVSCDPQCRDSRDWWMHAAGCPGSHVVIRYTGDDLPKETIIDAAVLAAKNSKANQVGRAQVSLVRCRQVSKPRGAKPGLVQLSGDIRTVTVNVKDEAERLERLMATKD
ncbi:hypothetical protein BE221DRAFT_201628 [Ostreococcus tauri]|uniref:NFACT RNA-binding domain-containing protein n=1 Tax=Ostreococcus tauri TaxID=70448 RepID=A0A1Y5I6H4_OSTTA|nr:hypothetical protein BE221DRAFT_201628 [Ostreococcus tauri]